MAGFRKEDTDGQIKWLIKINNKKIKKIIELEKENKELKQFIALQSKNNDKSK